MGSPSEGGCEPSGRIPGCRASPRRGKAKAPFKHNVNRPQDAAQANGNTVGFRRADGRADRSAPTEAKASRQGRRGAGFSHRIVPPRRLVSNEFPVDDLRTGLGETRTPTSFRTSAPKTDASAIPPRGPQFVSCQLSVVDCGLRRLPEKVVAPGGGIAGGCTSPKHAAVSHTATDICEFHPPGECVLHRRGVAASVIHGRTRLSRIMQLTTHN